MNSIVGVNCFAYIFAAVLVTNTKLGKHVTGPNVNQMCKNEINTFKKKVQP